MSSGSDMNGRDMNGRDMSRAVRVATLTPALGTRHNAPWERGSATVVMLAVIAAALMLTTSGLLLASVVLASHRARAAADLAALTAAGTLIRGESPAAACAAAARTVAANHGQVQQCLATGTEARLIVVVQPGVRGLGVATARSRAGSGPRPAR